MLLFSIKKLSVKKLSEALALRLAPAFQSLLEPIERKINDMATLLEDAAQAQAEYRRETMETNTAVMALLASFDEKLARIETLVQQDKDDASLRAGLPGVVSEMRADVATLNQIQQTIANRLASQTPGTGTPSVSALTAEGAGAPAESVTA